MLKKFFKPLFGIIFIAVVAIISFFAFNNTDSTEYVSSTLDFSRTENTYVLSEDNYEEQMTHTVEPFINSITTSGYFTSSDNTNIYYEYYNATNPKGSIVISHGFTESLEKYVELIYYFIQEGYNVYAVDHRGHGLSDRTSEDLSLVDVKDFNSYVTDLHQFVSEIVMPTSGDLPLFLYAHSMGGGIGTRFLETYPDVFDAAVLTAPMLGINLGGVPRFAANLLSSSAVLFGQGTQYIISHSAFDGVADLEGSAASSAARFNYYFNKKLAHEYLRTNGASYSWLYESLKATKNMLKPENIAKIETPILLFQAENDSLVLPEPQRTLVSHAKDAELIFVPNAKHELYNTENDIFIPYLHAVFDFYEAHLTHN